MFECAKSKLSYYDICTMDEDSKAAGVGLQWLTHLANGNDKNRYLSNDGKALLNKLLKDNYLRDPKKKKDYNAYGGDDDDDDDDDEEEEEESDSDDNMILSLYRGRQEISEEDESKRPKLFETILGVIYKLHKKYNRGNDVSKDTVKTPTTKEILKECLSRLEQSEGMDILRPENIPCSLDSNQFIFSALLFLSEDIYQDVSSSKGTPRTNGRSPSDNPYFPKMPLLFKRKISSSGSNSIMIPGGFLINFENIMLSSDHENIIFDKKFLRKLSMLESCFLSLSSKIEHIPRLHVIPRIGMGFIKNQEEEEKLMKLGNAEKAGLSTSNTNNSEGGASSNSSNSVKIEQKSKSLKRKISSVGNHSDNE